MDRLQLSRGTVLRADFEAFVAARYGALLGLAYLLTQDRQLAEDLVQTTLARCWLAWPRINSEDPAAYVRRVMVNARTEWWRRKQHGVEVPISDIGEVAVSHRHVGSGSPDLVEQAELIAALRTLPKKMCAVVVLRYFEDLTEAETARVLGCSIGTVKSQTHRALGKLHHELGLMRSVEER
ncbi:SigE family RNA polymerase sigma factor [Kribbella sp. NPDC056345]|uniref:SigE family RNA polymerase sigma factor n=1 Tax=Kribbella sp. NPDC056345 TaxID=3345789 RepID=UPI0035DBE07B